MKKLETIIKAAGNICRSLGHAAVLWNASVMLGRAIEDAEDKYRKDGHRYFIIWDPAQRSLISITYDAYKGRADSYQYLARRGRFPVRFSRDELKELCFHYTASRNGAPSCSDAEKKEKLLEWQGYCSRLSRSDRFSGIRKIWSWKLLGKKLSSLVN